MRFFFIANCLLVKIIRLLLGIKKKLLYTFIYCCIGSLETWNLVLFLVVHRRIGGFLFPWNFILI